MSKPIEELTDEEFDRYLEGAEEEDNDLEEEEVDVDPVEPEEDDTDDQEEDDQDTEDDEVDGEDEPEQPEGDADAEDSDDNEETDEDEDDETDEDSEDDAAAGEEDEEQPNEDSTEDQATVETPKYKVKANGMDFEFTPDELAALAPKALDYTKKMQQIKPYREMVSAIEDEGISKDDLNMLISAYKGDKGAVSELLKRNQIDTLDLEGEEVPEYKPRSYGRNEVELAIGDVVESIQGDKEYSTTDYIIRNQFDSKSRETIVERPELIAALHDDVKSGRYDKYAPLALKKKALEGGKRSELEYLQEAAYELAMQEKAAAEAEAKRATEVETKTKMVKEAKARQEKRTTTKKSANKRKAAATTKTGKAKPQVKDYLANDTMSDEEFSKLMEKQLR